MIDIKRLRENPDAFKTALKNKGANVDINRVLALDEERRKLISEGDALRAAHKILSKGWKNREDYSAKDKTEEIRILTDQKAKITENESQLKTIEEEFNALLYQIPNPPFDTVPVGKDDSENVVLREEGTKPSFSFPPKDYVTIGEQLNLIDTERAGKVSGSRFGYLKYEGPLLEFALVQLAMDTVRNEQVIARIISDHNLSITPKSFIPVVPPVLIKPEAMRAMGYVERGGDEIYFLEKDNLYLVGTSEQSVGPMHMNEIFDEKNLPLRYIAFSTCFRREAGSYGKDTKGILRVHQFDKVEMFSLCTPETSNDEHQLLLGIEEYLMQQLELPYHVLNICTGDLGDPAAAKYDIEAWLPGQQDGKGQYRETHSTSNTTDFQSRRLNIKMRRENGSTEFLHMLNGTAFAIGRMLIAILENYQQEDGSLTVPTVLRQYMGGLTTIKR